MSPPDSPRASPLDARASPLDARASPLDACASPLGAHTSPQDSPREGAEADTIADTVRVIHYVLTLAEGKTVDARVQLQFSMSQFGDDSHPASAMALSAIAMLDTVMKHHQAATEHLDALARRVAAEAPVDFVARQRAHELTVIRMAHAHELAKMREAARARAEELACAHEHDIAKMHAAACARMGRLALLHEHDRWRITAAGQHGAQCADAPRAAAPRGDTGADAAAPADA